MSVRPVAVLQLPWVRQAMALGMLATGAGLLWQFPQPLLLALLLVSLTTMACWPLAPAVAESAGADTPDSGDLPLSEGERAIWHEVEQLAEQCRSDLSRLEQLFDEGMSHLMAALTALPSVPAARKPKPGICMKVPVVKPDSPSFHLLWIAP